MLTRPGTRDARPAGTRSRPGERNRDSPAQLATASQGRASQTAASQTGAAPQPAADVAAIARLAAGGDGPARAVIDDAISALG